MGHDRGLGISRQPIPFRAVHQQQEGDRSGGHRVGLIDQGERLERAHSRPALNRPVDGAPVQPLVHLGRTQRLRRGVQAFEPARMDPANRADLLVGQILQTCDLGLHEERIGLGREEADHVHAVKAGQKALLMQLPSDDRGFLGRAEEEGQLEKAHLGELTGGIARQYPGDVRDAVLHQLELLERALAERPAPEALHPDRIAGLGADGLHPGFDHTRDADRLLRHKGADLDQLLR